MCVSHSIFSETGSDLTASDNCPPSPLLGWSFLMSFVRARACVCVCARAHGEMNHAAGRRQTPRCCPLNYTLSGCVSCWALSFLTRQEPSTGGWRGSIEDGWRGGWRGGDRLSSGPFEEGRWALRGLDGCLSLGLSLSFSAHFFFFLCWFCLSLTLFHFLSLIWL